MHVRFPVEPASFTFPVTFHGRSARSGFSKCRYIENQQNPTWKHRSEISGEFLMAAESLSGQVYAIEIELQSTTREQKQSVIARIPL